MTSFEPRDAEKIARMKKAGAIVKECLDILGDSVWEGVSTKALERKAEEIISIRGGRPAFRGYKGFPSSICASRNSTVVHGIPSEKETLHRGDIISIDVGVEYKGYFADGARTFPVGKISREAKTLIEVTLEALSRGVEMAVPGNHVHDISWAIQSFVESKGFSVVRAFVGHGIGKRMHEPPEVPNFGRPHTGTVLTKGMALAIEPMVNCGTGEVTVLDDGWTAVTKDGMLSAHFEHTVIVEEKEASIIT